MPTDTAQNYANETEAGIAIRDCGLPRESIFVTTKWSGLAGLNVASSFRNSLKNVSCSKACIPNFFSTYIFLHKLGLTYVDLYLIHSPDLCDKDGFQTCWKEMEKLKDAGLAKSEYTMLSSIPTLL
jgi:diketogulonate reductase-like aldo/keto reductase